MAGTVEREFVPGFARSTQPLFTLPPKQGEGPRAVPPESDLVRFGESLFQTAKAYRDQQLGMLDRWRTYRSWYLNNGGAQNTSQRSLTYVNLIFEKVEKLTADLSEGQPTFLYGPNTPQDLPLTNLLNEAIPFIWNAQSGDQQYFQTLKGSTLYGTWYWKIIHDPRFGKQGSVERIIQVPCWYIFPAPHAISMQNAPWVIHVQTRTVGEIWNDYGVKVEPELIANQIFPDISEDMRNFNTATGSLMSHPDATTPITTATDRTEAIPDTFLGTDARSGMVIQKELWVRDGTLQGEWWFDETQTSPQLKKTATLKYPRGRVISWANGKLLYDRENPYKDGRFPFVKFTDISVPDFWYGMGEVEGLINLQLLHDDTVEMMKLTHLYMSIGRLIVDKGTGLEEGRMGNDPGEIWWVREGTSDRVNWLPGATPPAEFYSHTASIERWADLVTGSFDVTRGVNPTGVTAGRALITLQNAANIRIRSRLRDIEAALVDGGKMLASRVQQFWTENMSLRVTGERLNGSVTDFKNFRLSAEDREAGFNLKVNAVANIERLRAQEFQKFLLLFQMGLIGPEALIEAADLSNEEQVLADLPLLLAQRQAAQPPQNVIGQQRSIGRGMNPAGGQR